MSSSVGLVADAPAVAAALGPLRRRILGLLDVPDSATGLARRLGVSRQRINYHVRALESAGLVELVEERQRRGAIERVVRRTADALVVDPTVLSPRLHAASRDEAGAMAVVGGATDAIRGVTAAAATAEGQGRRLAAAAADTTIRVSSPRALHALLADLATTLSRHDAGDSGGLALRIATLVWPSTPPEEPS